MKQNSLYKNTDSYYLTELLWWTFIHDEDVLSLSITPLPCVFPFYVPILDILTSKLFYQKRITTGTIINFLSRIWVGKKYWDRQLRKSEQMELELHAMSPLRITKIIKYKVMTQFHSAIGPISMFVLPSLFLFLVDIRRLNLSNWQVIGCHITSFVEREMSLIVTVGRSAIKINVIPFVKKKMGFFLY